MEKFLKDPVFVPVDHDPFSGYPLELTAPTTAPQREVWAASQMSTDASCSYNESVSLELKGKLDLDLLNRTMAALVQRHESLRTVFESTGVRMLVLKDMDLTPVVHDLSALPQQERQERMQEIGMELMETPFDLTHGPLFRAAVFTMGAAHHVLRIVAHHIVCDGWSMSILIGDLSKIYAAGGNAAQAELPPPVSASMYAQEMNAFYASDGNEKVKAYWKQLFAEPLPQLDLPTDYPRPWEKTWNAKRIDIGMEPELVDGLKRLGTRFGSSFVTTLMAVYEVLLARITGQHDIVVGLPAAGQSDMDMEELVGHCVALLPLRSQIYEERAFSEHLQYRKKALLDAFDHQRFTFSTLLHELKVPRDPGRVPLVPVIFNLDMEMDDRVAFPGIAHTLRSEPRSHEQFELAMNASSSQGRLTLEWSYNTDLFKEETIRGWMKELNMLIRAVIADPSIRLQDLIEKGRALSDYPAKDWIGSVSVPPQASTIATEFDRIAREYADRPALVQGQRTLTYAEVRDHVDGLATELIAKGAVPGMPIVVCAEPGFDLIIGLLAVIRAGGAFVPIDHTYPEARIAYLLSDSGAQILLTTKPLFQKFAGFEGTTLAMDHTEVRSTSALRPAFQGTTDDPAYMIYTSGSTGEPKGVVVPHRGILRILHDQPFVEFGPSLTSLFNLSISFDACQLTVMGTLLSGGTMVMPAGEKPGLADFVEAIRDHGVNCLFTASGYFKLLVDEHLAELKRLKYLVTGGDAISVPHVRKAFRALGPGVVINVYGPTESSVLCSYYPVMDESWTGSTIPIGKPLGNTLLHVLDAQLRPVRIGQTGELYTGGSGVALGYWKRPELTARHFLPDPFSPIADALMYRTGDMVRWNEEGELEFSGRVDDQVKVRGYRVELGEVESMLDNMPAVKDKVVVALPSESGEQRLVLYVVPADLSIVASGANGHQQDAGTTTFLAQLEAHLGAVLPQHMVPSDIMVIPSMPLNSSGKPDKKRLPAPSRSMAQMRTEHVAPRNEVEGVLVGIWAKLLGHEQVSVHDNFFEIGGHSLLGIQMFAHVERQLGKRLPIKSLFQAPTIAKLATTIMGPGQPELSGKNLSAIQPKGDRPPFFCVHGDEANIFLPKHLGEDQPFYGFFHQGEDGQPIMFKTVKGIAEHFIREMRQVRPHGPYYLGGYSFGGIVSFEMACQLAAAGESVPLVALFDTYSPEESVEITKEEQKIYEPIKQRVMRRLIKYYFGKGHALPPKLRHFHIIDTYAKAIEQYIPPVFPGKLTLIRTKASPGTEDMGWRKLAGSGLDIHLVDGDHYSIVKEPHVRQLAQELRRSIDLTMNTASTSNRSF